LVDDLADHDPPAPLRGDEATPYRDFNDELMREVGRRVLHDMPDTVEEACAFAWAQFLRRQPSREQNWHGWLFLTAMRQAWAIELTGGFRLRWRSDSSRMTSPKR
jgi:hypothetical protein